MKKRLSLPVFTFFTILALVLGLAFPMVKASASGQGNCLDPNASGWIKEDTGGTTVTINADSGDIITSVTVKAGSSHSSDNPCNTFTQDGTYECYSVSGLGTNSVTVTKVGSGPNCKDISHLEGLEETAPPPTDVCPNIEGNQGEIPTGLIKDENGNCVPPPDFCPNIPGTQDAVPEGMVVDDQGNCVTPPPPPTDVCPNLEGLQTVVPDGYTQDEEGNCIPPEITDVCPNIEGVQASVPEGLIVNDEGNCVEPPPPPTDVCPNLEGNQASVPDGYQLDGEGNCVPIPPEIDPFCYNGLTLYFPVGQVPDGAKPGGCAEKPTWNCGDRWNPGATRKSGFWEWYTRHGRGYRCTQAERGPGWRGGDGHRGWFNK